MKKVLLLAGLFISLFATAQVPTVDSLHRAVNRFIGNNATEAFLQGRLNNILHGVLFRIDSAGSGSGTAGVDTLYTLNDTTIRYKRNGSTYDFSLKGIYDARRKVDTIYALNDSTFRYTVNGSSRDVVIPGATGGEVAAAIDTFYLDVKRDFLAAGDGVTDDAGAIQDAFDWIEDHPSRAYRLVFPAGDYKIGSTITLPGEIDAAAESPRLLIEGYGARLFTTAAIPIFERMPATQTEAANTLISNWIGHFKGITFEGNSTTGQVGIRAGATYSWVYEDCNFYALDTAIVSVFALQNHYTNLRFTNNKSVAIKGASGYNYWSGATTSNSAFNGNIIGGNRIYNGTGSYAGVYLLASDGNIIRDHISEGFNPRYDFYVDYMGSVVVNSVAFSNIWLESTGGTHGSKNVSFYLRTPGTVQIAGLQNDYLDTILQLANDMPQAKIIARNWAYFNTGATTIFDGAGALNTSVTMEVSEMPVAFMESFFDATKWSGGVVGTYVSSSDFSASSSVPGLRSSAAMNLTPTGSLNIYGTGSNIWGGTHLRWYNSTGTTSNYNRFSITQSNANTLIDAQKNGTGTAPSIIWQITGNNKISLDSANTTYYNNILPSATETYNLGSSSRYWSTLYANYGIFGQPAIYDTNYILTQLPDSGFVTRSMLENAVAGITGNVYKDDYTIVGNNTFDDPLRVDTSTYIATKTDLLDGKDSIGRSPGIDSLQVYRNGVHIYSVEIAADTSAAGNAVLTDITLTGDGSASDTLKVDTTVVATKYYVDNLPGITPPDGTETKIIAGNGISVTGDGSTTNQYVITNTGTSGSNPHNALSILNYGGVADAVVGSTSVTGTNNTPALQAMLNAAADGQMCIIPSGNYLFSTVLDTIQSSKSVHLVILGNTYHQSAGTAIDFIILANAGGPTEQHVIEHYGECTGKVGIPTFNEAAYLAGTSPVWSTFTGTPFKIYNSNQHYVKFNRIQGFKNGVEVIGYDYDGATRGSEENIVIGRMIQNCANGTTLTSINGRSYVDKTYFGGWGNSKMTIRCGLAIKVDGYSGAAFNGEIYNGAFRSNEWHLLVERCDSIADVNGDVTEPTFDVTVEGSGVHSNIGWRMRTATPNNVRDPRWTGEGVYGYQWMNSGQLGTNARGDVPIWNSVNGRRYTNNWRTDGSSNFIAIGSTLSKFQRDDSPSWINYAPGNDFEKYVSVTASTYTPVTGDRWISVNNATHTLTLPAATSNIGKRITIFNDHSSNALTVSNTSNNTSIPAGDVMTYVSNGSIWRGEINVEGTGSGGLGIFTADAAGYYTASKIGLGGSNSSTSTFVRFAGATTSVSSLRIASGSHPTSPADGDEWRVAAARYMAYNGVTYTYLTIPDNGVAGQAVVRNAANDGYEHKYIASAFGTMRKISNANYTVVDGDYSVIIHSMTASRTLTLPSAASYPGRVLVIGQANGNTNTINLSATVYDGTSTISQIINENKFMIQSDGTNWQVIMSKL